MRPVFASATSTVLCKHRHDLGANMSASKDPKNFCWHSRCCGLFHFLCLQDSQRAVSSMQCPKTVQFAVTKTRTAIHVTRLKHHICISLRRPMHVTRRSRIVMFLNFKAQTRESHVNVVLKFSALSTVPARSVSCPQAEAGNAFGIRFPVTMPEPSSFMQCTITRCTFV
jgi:hypothetical protein